ncbi:tail fiber assembly protein [Providencia alcalifaciens]
MYYYSAKTNAFYPEALRKNYEENYSFPDDVIRVSESIWLKYAGMQPPTGMVRVADEDGMPKWSPLPEKTNADFTKEAESKKEKILFEIIRKTQIWQTQLSLEIINDSDKSKLKEWMIYAQKIQNLDVNKAPHILWPKPPKK